jgi:Flp pilus assembly protein TadB
MAIEARAPEEPQAPEEGASGAESVPGATEEVHLPEPSYLPAVLAFGIMWALVGIVISWVVCVIGGVIAIVALWRWIKSARQDMAELPLEH